MSEYKFTLAAGTSLACLASMLGSLPVHAQTASQPILIAARESARAGGAQTAGATDVAEVVVTASKREERLLDVGMSVSAFRGATLLTQGVVNLTDLDKVVPGLTFSNSQGGSPVPTLRGVGFSDISLDATPDVSVYVDQFPLFVTSLTKGVNLDLERVEVMKGPQGTLFGENATGGAINYITAKPTKSFDSGADLTVARFGRVDVNGYVSGPLSDTLTARLALHTEQGGAWQRSYTRSTDNTLGNRNFTSGRLVLDWRPTDRLETVASFTTWQDHSDGAAGADYHNQLLPGFPVTNAQLANYPLAPHNPQAADWDPLNPPKYNDQFYQGNVRTDYDLGGNVEFTNLLQYLHETVNDELDADGTNLDDVNFTQMGKSGSFYEEARFSNSGTSRLHWIAGANYEGDSSTEHTINNPAGANTSLFYAYLVNELANPACPSGALTLPVAPPYKFPSPCYNYPNNANDGLEKTTSYAAFANLEYNLTSELLLKGGIRYTHDEHDNTSCSMGLGDPSTGPIYTFLYRLVGVIGSAVTVPSDQCLTYNPSSANPFSPVRGKLSQDNVPWHVGIDWKPSKNWLLYAGVSKGFKAGGFPVLSAPSADQLASYSQEALLSYEVGLKARVNQALTLEASSFYYDYTDKQIISRINDPLFGPLQAIVNIPKSSVKGAEVDASWSPVKGLTIDASGSYLDAQVDKFVGYNQDGVAGDYKGSPLPFTPKWSVSVDVAYERDLSDQLIGFGGLHVSYRSAAFDSIGPRPGIDDINSYALLNLRAGVRSSDGSWRLMFWGKNVTNTYYAASQGLIYETYTRFPGMPATYGATFAVRFR
jgi:iron complex outermembrane receptor protein